MNTALKEHDTTMTQNTLAHVIPDNKIINKITIRNTKQKKWILEEYQARSSSNITGKPIIFSKKGKHTLDQSPNKWNIMKPELNKSYWVKGLNLYHDIVIILGNASSFLASDDTSHLKSINKDFNIMILKIHQWSKIDFLTHKNHTTVMKIKHVSISSFGFMVNNLYFLAMAMVF